MSAAITEVSANYSATLFPGKSAEISPCRRYRYRLSRSWGMGPRVAWLMFNPSTADAFDDDHTIRKCVGFAKLWGFEGIDVINLFALRSTKPDALLEAVDPIGEDHMKHFAAVLRDASLLVCAWGCESTLAKMKRRGWRQTDLVGCIGAWRVNLPVECLGKSKSGNPYHPLMLAYDTPRQPFKLEVSK